MSMAGIDARRIAAAVVLHGQGDRSVPRAGAFDAQFHLRRRAVAHRVGQAFLGNAVHVDRHLLRQGGKLADHVQAEDGARGRPHIVVPYELPEAGLQPDLFDVLRPQAHQRAAQVLHHPPLDAGDGAGVIGKVGPFRRRAGLDARRQCRRRRQALPELVVEIPRQSPALLFLHLEQTRGERRARRIGAGQRRREVVDGARDQIEFGGAEPGQAAAEIALLQPAQSIDDGARRDQRVSDHHRSEHRNGCGHGRRDPDDDGNLPPCQP
jgi:hypothetical protein